MRLVFDYQTLKFVMEVTVLLPKTLGRAHFDAAVALDDLGGNGLLAICVGRVEPECEHGRTHL